MSSSIEVPLAPHRLSVLDRLARRIVLRSLSQMTQGTLQLNDAAGIEQFSGTGELQATIKVHKSRFFRQAILGGRLSLAESYFRGDWDCDDLTSLFRIIVRNRQTSDRLDAGFARILGWGHQLYHWRRTNTQLGSRKNIAAHYDLGNDFYRLWLDDTLAYSSGIFTDPDCSLQSASLEKFDRVCRKLALSPGDHVIEIGTGWGGFALHAAGQYGAQVTTTTISAEQYAIARERIDQAELSQRVTLLQQDYRNLQGEFDKLVSIEMIEAVGKKYFDVFFELCGRLLKPNGSMVLQAIVMPEKEYPAYLRSVDFIQRHVFPGGCLPSLGAMLDSIGRTSDLRMVHAEDFGSHYAETLRRWRLSFEKNLGAVRTLGYSEHFIRLWRYYLCYCEAAFDERCVSLLQVQFDKPECRRDLIHTGPWGDIPRNDEAHIVQTNSLRQPVRAQLASSEGR